jgi:hypothetical protein
MDLKISNINKGDSQSDLTNKLNYNFSQILANFGGASGKTGKIGPAGDNGLTGPTGPAGKRGERGNIWHVSDTEPTIDLLEGDYWVDTINDCEVKRYEFLSGSLSWVSQNFLISQAGVFEIDASIVGSTSGVPNQGYVQNLFFPEKNTLILTDAVTGDVKNPQLSKIVLGNTGGSNVNPLLEFTKSDYQGSSSFYSKTPRFVWGATGLSSSNAYGISFLGKDGMDFEVGSFTSQSQNFTMTAGNYTAVTDNGGITGDFSGSVYLSAGDDFLMTYGPTSSTNPLNLDVVSQNVTQWNDNVFTASLPISFSGQPSNTYSNILTNALRYTRTQQPLSTENLFRATYKGIAGYSGLAGQDKDIYVTDSRGNSKFGKKISGYYPDPGVRSSTNSMGTIAYSGLPTGTHYYFTIISASPLTGNTSIDDSVNKYLIGEIFFPDINPASSVKNTLAIHVPTTGTDPWGFGYLLSGDTEAIKFCVDTGTARFNSIYLDSKNNNTPSYGALSLLSTDPRISVLTTGINDALYATFFEFTLIRLSTTSYKLYYQASGGNISTYLGDSSFISGVVSTQ